MIIFRDMRTVLWTRNKADLFYVALEEKAEPTGGNWECAHLSAVYGRDFKHWMERGHWK